MEKFGIKKKRFLHYSFRIYYTWIAFFNFRYYFLIIYKYINLEIFSFLIYYNFINIYIYIYLFIYLKIALNSDISHSDDKYFVDTVDNASIISFKNETDALLNRYIKFNFDFLFSQDFDSQMQDIFLNNFINNNVFKNNNITINGNTILTSLNKTFENYNVTEDNTYKFNITVVNNLSEITENSKSKEKDGFLCGIVFDTTTEYSIYILDSGISFQNSFELYIFESFSPKSDIFNEFYLIQALTSNAIYKTLTNSTNSKNIYISTKTMDLDGISESTILQSSIESFILYMTLFFAPSILALLNHLVVEKESKIKESMLIIGLKNSSFWLSWAIIYSFIILFNSIIATIIIYHYKLMPFIHWSAMIFIMVIYGLSCCCVSFILSTFLKKSKIAMIISGFIIFTFYIISNIILIMYRYYKEAMPLITIINFFFPPSAFVFLIKRITVFEYTGHIITLFSIFKNKNILNSFICLVFSFILYFFIAIYLDNILPQGNNIHRKWHFFITDIFKNNYKKLETNISNININNPFIQPDPKNQKLAAVEVRHIKKKFNVKEETIEVLNDISFNAYYDEIFAILGHNGAGKTTLMSIMTGILPSNSGEVYYNNVPISGNVKDICKDFGYCPQFDAFNNNLTVSEHIKLYAGFKNIKVNIDEILEKYNLLDKKNEFPKHLSGGQKRK